MTGLAAGLSSGLPVYEAEETPGGICSSYYIRPECNDRLQVAPSDGNAYRFEIGGGHWIFGGDPLVLRFMRSLAPMKTHVRSAGVYFPDQDLYTPSPVQNNLRHFGSEVAARALREIIEATKANHPITTMADWLEASFGQSLCELFFHPFHELYTAGLWRSIAPQDDYKSPADFESIIQGAFDETPFAGYNSSFTYPIDGLNSLAQGMAAQCDIRYGKRVVHIDVKDRSVSFEDGSTTHYDTLLSTLPLNRMMETAGLTVDEEPYPSPAVLVINIGAVKAPECPRDQWVYIPNSKARFHRVGFYSNVDHSFLPKPVREQQDHVSIYVEKAYPEGQKPSEGEVKSLSGNVIQELQDWGWIGAVEVVDPTWIDVAYTWSWPRSRWKEKALKRLEEHGIYQTGRFGRWVFQGIADSIRDGLIAGAATKKMRTP